MSRPSTDYRIEVANEQKRCIDERQLVTATELVLQEYGIHKSEISIAVVDDATIRDLNRRYLDHDYETDVLSFVLERDERHLEGEIVISAETAAREALLAGWSLHEELLLYAVHGALHLAGYEDRSRHEAVEMETLCDEFVRRQYRVADAG